MEECGKCVGSSQFQSGDDKFDVDRVREDEAWEAYRRSTDTHVSIICV